ncbi:MAG: CBS domain-containing protein [Flavobacteriales bacterium]|nr:CBS domain-containing protein [Flavobacteriales bacterium]MCB9449467.1 CBS domain-containing protein [Flavobacteriales bacterium]
MLARDLITDEIPPLKTSDNGIKALNWMDELKVHHLPIVNHHDFLGLISEADILDLNAPDSPLGNHSLTLVRPYVLEDVHFYEVIKVMAEQNLSLLPVLDDQSRYLGNITLNHLVQKMASIASIREPGGIVVLDLNTNDYSLSEIAHIVEGNDTKILSSYITSPSDSTKLELTLKLNRTDITRVLASLERHDYTIKASYHESEMGDTLKDRYDQLMNYLNI